MPSTFNVISLGTLADIDTIEGNFNAENAGALVGLTFGGPGTPLVDDFVELSPGTPDFDSDGNTYYDQNDATPEAFRIDGGPDQFFDATSVYNATVTFVDGSTANVTAVIFQDTNGNTYMAPEFSNNADMAALESDIIESLTLDSLLGSNYLGMTGSREEWNFVTCFGRGTLIETPMGAQPIESLKQGQGVTCGDTVKPIRWIGKRRFGAEVLSTNPKLRPVRILAGSLGGGLPKRDLVVSRQHRMLLSSVIAERMFATREVLVPAIKLTALPGVFVDDDIQDIEYFHLLFDRHEIISAEGADTESLFTGPEALRSVSAAAKHEILTIFPELADRAYQPQPARLIPPGKQQKRLIARHVQNNKPVVMTHR